jgi:metallo-beta-lactamase class B
MPLTRARSALLSSLIALLTLPLAAQSPPEWSEPFPAHKVVGNVYYVGSKGLASYLITTPEGHILINSNLESSPALIQKSVEKLGFKMSDVKILLISHAHWDHDAGSAALVKMTGAKYMVMDGDVDVVESGGKTDFQYANETTYPAVKVDRVLHDGDTVRLGGTVLTAHLTAGHTKGCTTWTLKVKDSGKEYNVVIVGSPNVNPGYKLVNNQRYPQIASDYEHEFQVLKSLPCDIFLGAHGDYYGMEAKFAKLVARNGPDFVDLTSHAVPSSPGGANPFVDPEGYKRYIADREQAFRKELEKQKATAK